MSLLSLDISTSITGWALFSSGSLVRAGFVSMKEKDLKGDLFKKLDFLIGRILEEVKEEEVDKIIVEEALKKFTKGFSSAHTINSLIAFNFAVRYQLYKELGIVAEGINVSSARAKVGIKFPKEIKSLSTSAKRTTAKKEHIASLMEARYPKLVDWPKKKTGRFKDSCYDVADAIVLALSTL